MNGYFIKHTNCERCGSSDARALYSDGGAYCFSCCHGSRGSHITFEEKTERVVQLPHDASRSLGQEGVVWAGKCGIGVEELLKQNVLWSESRKQLLFTWLDEDNNLLAYQARNFHAEAKSKCFTQGNVNDLVPIYAAPSNLSNDLGSMRHPTSTLVVVEDPLSAIKIARQSDCLPCLGSSLPPQKIKRLAGLYNSFLIWLDADKYLEAQKMARKFQLLGREAQVRYSELDPKYYSDEEIFLQLS